MDVKVKEDLIQLHDQRSVDARETPFHEQLSLLLHCHSKVNVDGTVAIASSSTIEAPTPPESPTRSLHNSEIKFESEGPRPESMGSARGADASNPFLFDTGGFSLFDYGHDHLLRQIWPIFHSFGLTEKFEIDPKKFAAFTRQVKSRYQMNHYHNFRHAFDVLLTVSRMVRKCTDFEFPDVTKLGLFIAAICHDMKHPGLTNAFLVKVKSPVATLYNGQSVLENFHAMSTIALLHESECDILQGLSPCQREECETTIVEAILWTDMAMHDDKLHLFEETMKNETITSKGFNIIAAMLLKCSDVSNVWKPWRDSYRWSSLLIREQIIQGDMESTLFGERSIGPETMLDHRKVEAYIGRNTVSFIGHFVEPMVALVASYMPSIRDQFDTLANNAALYRTLEKEAEAGARIS